jgi:hypothetical protein
LMDPSAEFRVSSRNGEISNTKKMGAEDWEAFEITAETTHGDSGGPVIDDDTGRVIGITVAATFAAGHNLAIPINVAKELLNTALTKANILNIDPGPQLKDWEDGLNLFAKGDYAQARLKFKTVLRREDLVSSNGVLRAFGPLHPFKNSIMDFGESKIQAAGIADCINSDFHSSYVEDLLQRCYKLLAAQSPNAQHPWENYWITLRQSVQQFSWPIVELAYAGRWLILIILLGAAVKEQSGLAVVAIIAVMVLLYVKREDIERQMHPDKYNRSQTSSANVYKQLNPEERRKVDEFLHTHPTHAISTPTD